MNLYRWVFLSAFVLVLGAGVVLGKVWSRLAVEHSTPNSFRRTYPESALDLTAEQKQAMDSIWSDTRQKIGVLMDERRGIEGFKDQEIMKLLTDPQRAAYAKINEDCRQRRTDLDKQREKLIHDAEDRSRSLLTDEQKKKWDTIGPNGPERPRRRGGPATRRSSSMPAAPATGPVAQAV